MISLDAVTGTGARSVLSVDLAVMPAELLLRQRTRLVARLAGLDAQGWRRPTKCPLWDVADVVTHLVDATGWALGTLAAAQTGGVVPGALEGFDPGKTPHEHVLAGRGQAPEVLLARLRDLTGTLAGRLGDAEGSDGPRVRWVGGDIVYSPGLAGLHLLWDSWLHEQDLDAALGAEGIAPCPLELDAVAAYGLFFAGLVLRHRLGPDDRVSVRAELDDLRFDLRLGSTAQLSRATGAAPEALVVRGPAVQTVEALAGRGDLADVAEGPPLAIALLSGLGARMRAPAV